MKKLCARANSIRSAGRVPEDIILDKTKNGQPSHRKNLNGCKLYPPWRRSVVTIDLCWIY